MNNNLLLIAQEEFYECVRFKLHLVHISILIFQDLHHDDMHQHHSQYARDTTKLPCVMLMLRIPGNKFKAVKSWVSTERSLENVTYQQFGLQQNL